MSPRDIRKFKKATAGALLNVRTIHTEQMSPGRRRPARTSTVAPPNALVWPWALPAPGFAVTVAAGFLIVETVLVVLLKQVEPEDPVGIVYAVLMGVALVGNFVAGVAAAASASADRRREAELSSELAHIVLRTGDLQSAANEAGRHLAAAFNLRFASVELTKAAGDHRPGAIPLHEDDVLVGVLEVPDDLPRTTLERLLRVVPTLEALLAAARDREKVNNRLIESRHRLEQFFDLTSDLMVISDQGKLLEVNPAFEKALGYTVDDLAPAPFELVPPEDLDRLREPIKDLTDGRGPVRFENRATTATVLRDGSNGASRRTKDCFMPSAAMSPGNAKKKSSSAKPGPCSRPAATRCVSLPSIRRGCGGWQPWLHAGPIRWRYSMPSTTKWRDACT